MIGKQSTLKSKKILEEKYPTNLMPGMQYDIGEKTIILKDSFVKKVLIDTIDFDSYSSKKKQDKKILENFFSATMAGEYTLEQFIITKTEIVPGNDSSDEYYAYSNGNRFEIQSAAYKRCNTGVCLVAVTVKGMPIHSILILLDVDNEQPLVAWHNSLYQLKYRMPKNR